MLGALAADATALGGTELRRHRHFSRSVPVRHACILCLTLLSGSCESGSSRSARADQPVAVPTGEEVSCRSCSLSFQRLRSFPHGDDDTLFGPHAQLMVLASGKAVV